MTEEHLDQLLREWAESILKEAEVSLEPAWAKKVCIHSQTVVIPNYWPNRRIWKVNDEILSLETSYRNSLTGIYILGLSERQLASRMGETRYRIRKYIREARQRIRKNLT